MGKRCAAMVLMLLATSVMHPVWASAYAEAPAPAATVAGSSRACVSAPAQGPVAGGSQAAANNSAATAAAPVAAKAAAPPASKTSSSPLQANGLIVRTLREIEQWAGGLGVQFDELKKALLGLLALFARSEGRISDENRQILLQTAMALGGIFFVGLAVEWVIRRALRHPLQQLMQKAERAESNGNAEDGRQSRAEAQQQAAQTAAVPASDKEKQDVAAGTRPAREGVALVSVQRAGVQRVEEVPVGTRNTDSEPDDARKVKPAKGVDPHAPRNHRPAKYVHALRRLMYSAAACAFDLFPLAVFLVISALLMHELAGTDARVHAVASDFVDAYVTTRVIVDVLRLFMAPGSRAIRVVQVTNATALTLHNWLLGIVALAAFGIAVGNAAETLGATPQGRIAFIKIVSLFVHIAAVMLVLRLRRPARRAIAASSGATGTMATLRHVLARAWVPFAVVLVMGEWVVWAMGVEDGFPKLLHFIAVTAAILIGARLATILCQGVLGRAFHVDALRAGDTSSPKARLARMYYPAIRRLVSLLITACALIALFQAWGFHASDWFSQGAIGRSLTSAAITILVAAAVAISIWEASSISIERRIEQWSQNGDTLRAARLRTLLPMLRTSLFVGVVLVVGLTALNEIGVNTTPLLASASIVGVALGFGSQKLVQDFITGIFLLMENAMQVGDSVTVAGVSGTVENLSVRTVRLRAGDGSLYTVPFSSVTTVNNTNRGIGNAAVSVSVTHEIDIERAIDALKRIGAELRGDPAYRKLTLKDIEVWGVDSMDGSKITLIGQMQCTDSGRWGVQREINARIVKRFREAGIELANPRTSLLLTPDTARPASNQDGDTAEESANH